MARFQKQDTIRVVWLASGDPEAEVLEKAKTHGIPASVFNKKQFLEGTAVIRALREKDIDLLVLAGFMWKLPPKLVDAYAGRIINTHPALLPAHGGKGMYGIHVHRAVIRNGERKSGFTAHYVTHEYDAGPVIGRIKCRVYPGDTPESLQERVKALEKTFFPYIVELEARSIPEPERAMRTVPGPVH